MEADLGAAAPWAHAAGETGKRRRGARPSLLVAPRSVLPYWVAEAARFAPQLHVLDFSGPDRWQATTKKERAGCDLVLTTYALLRADAVRFAEGLLDPTRRQRASTKLEVLLPRLEQLADEGHKALVFAQFTSFLDLVEPELRARGIVFERLDGQTRDRGSRVGRFQTDARCAVFLISLKAGGFGLNLTAADYVFVLDPWWNPAAETQAIDRAHRIGQKRTVHA